MKKVWLKQLRKADRVAAEGLTGVYINGNVAAVAVILGSVAKSSKFVELVNATLKLKVNQLTMKKYC